MLSDARMGLRYARGLTRYLTRPLDPATIDGDIRTSLANRGVSFLWVIEHAVYGRPGSPYLPLLKSAGIELGDVVTLVNREGIEAGLGRLYDAGVRLSLEEFKGRRSIERSPVSFDASPASFDNPLIAGDLTLASGGSRGPRRRMLIDLGLLAHEARLEYVVARDLEGLTRPAATWRAVPPGSAGLKAALRRAKQGRPLSRWFTPNPISFTNGNARHSLLTTFSSLVGQACGGSVPWPRHVPLEEAWKVASWLAHQKALGEPPLLDANVSSSVRVCRAAMERGLDISGTVFRMGGEPYTEGKARVIAEAGCRGFVHYSMAELGRIGLACGTPEGLDDVHVLNDKLAVIERPVTARGGGGTVNALFMTSIHPASPKILLNVDSGDYARLTRRRCGCGFGALGFDCHLRDIRSHEKLTSEGMHFVGDELVAIIEHLLPSRFGGHSIDYQFVEREESGLTKVDLLVSPRLGTLDEGRILAAVLERLAEGGPAQAMMASRWRAGGTLRIARRDPYTSSTAKVLTLHSTGPPA
jgi:hypothetical protein